MTLKGGRLEVASVVARAEQLASSFQCRIQTGREPDLQALDAARERAGTRGLGDEVHVVRQHVELDDPEARFLRGTDHGADALHQPLARERRRCLDRAQRDVLRKPRRERLPRRVRDRARLARPAGAGPHAAAPIVGIATPHQRQLRVRSPLRRF